MAVFSGCAGKVLADDDELAHVRRWSFTWAVEPRSYSSSSTNCVKQRIAGPKDVTGGRVEVYVDDSDPLEGDVMIGDLVTLKLYENATRFWTITNAMIVSIEPGADIEEGNNVGATMNFEGGTVTIPA